MSMELDGPHVPRRAPGALDAEVDGELVLLSPSTLGYFGAEGTGGEVWALVDGTRSVDGIVAELAAQYDAAPDVIRADTTAYLTALRDAGLIEV